MPVKVKKPHANPKVNALIDDITKDSIDYRDVMDRMGNQLKDNGVQEAVDDYV